MNIKEQEVAKYRKANKCFHKFQDFQKFKEIWHIDKRNGQVGLSRATLDSQVNVFHFDLTELPSKCIQWVKYLTLLTKEMLGPKTWLQQNFGSKKILDQKNPKKLGAQTNWCPKVLGPKHFE